MDFVQRTGFAAAMFVERVLSKGEPQKGFLLKPSDAYLIPFSLVWVGCAVLGEPTGSNGA
ncbi:MAG: hypothetical protein ABSB82_19400 [Terriglobia bacterium]